MVRSDPLAYLLDLDEEILVQEGGYWVKIEARMCERLPQMPHGIRYSLTLHDRKGARVLGFDNAHPLPRRRGGSSVRRVEYDHHHQQGHPIAVYEFTDAGKLLEDFFAAVDRALKERGVI